MDGTFSRRAWHKGRLFVSLVHNPWHARHQTRRVGGFVHGSRALGLLSTIRVGTWFLNVDVVR